MILHIGNGRTVKHRGIIGIFDFDHVTTCRAGREFISKATRAREIEYATADIPRSFILCDSGRKDRARRGQDGCRPKKEKNRIILSHISSLSLCRRVENGPLYEEET